MTATDRPDPARASVLVLAPGVVGRLGDARLRDLYEYFEPDATHLAAVGARGSATDPDERSTTNPDGRGTTGMDGRGATNPDGRRARARLDYLADGPVFAPSYDGGEVGLHDVRGVQVFVAARADDLAALAERERAGDLDAEAETYVLSDCLAVDCDPTALTATLGGRADYVDALDPDALDGSYTHVSGALPSDYCVEWDGLRLRGGAADLDEPGTPIPCLELRADGVVSTRTLSPGRLGLRALPGVGERTAARLRDAGYATRADVAAASVGDLARLDGVGTTTAERVAEGARAVAEGEVVRTGDGRLPGGDPVFVDVETDGLSPSIVWLVGALDARTGEYRDFLQRDPDDPGGAVSAFVAWYAANAAGRPLVAYNGRSFDFPVLGEHVVRHAPALREDWGAAPTFDPYRWATDDGNAVLPGRTNKLADVAAALGHEAADTDLSGGAVARAYRAWMRDRTSETELDWERHRAYCEDDVRALACVYDAIADADRLASSGDERSEGTVGDGRTEDTVQGSLSDW